MDPNSAQPTNPLSGQQPQIPPVDQQPIQPFQPPVPAAQSPVQPPISQPINQPPVAAPPVAPPPVSTPPMQPVNQPPPPIQPPLQTPVTQTVQATMPSPGLTPQQSIETPPLERGIPTPSSARESTPHSSHSWLSKILIISAAILLLAAGGTYYFVTQSQNNASQKQVIVEAPKNGCRFETPVCVKAPCPTIEVCATPTPSDPTAYWKIYTSTQSGYMIKYPPTWSRKETETIFLSPTEIKLNEGPGAPITLTRIDESTVEKEVSKYKKAFNYVNLQDEAVPIGTISARKISGNLGPGYLEGTFNSQVFIPKGDSIITISFYEDSLVNQDLFTQILSTFKFTL